MCNRFNGICIQWKKCLHDSEVLVYDPWLVDQNHPVSFNHLNISLQLLHLCLHPLLTCLLWGSVCHYTQPLVLVVQGLPVLLQPCQQLLPAWWKMKESLIEEQASWQQLLSSQQNARLNLEAQAACTSYLMQPAASVLSASSPAHSGHTALVPWPSPDDAAPNRQVPYHSPKCVLVHVGERGVSKIEMYCMHCLV